MSTNLSERIQNSAVGKCAFLPRFPAVILVFSKSLSVEHEVAASLGSIALIACNRTTKGICGPSVMWGPSTLGLILDCVNLRNSSKTISKRKDSTTSPYQTKLEKGRPGSHVSGFVSRSPTRSPIRSRPFMTIVSMSGCGKRSAARSAARTHRPTDRPTDCRGQHLSGRRGEGGGKGRDFEQAHPPTEGWEGGVEMMGLMGSH